MKCLSAACVLRWRGVWYRLLPCPLLRGLFADFVLFVCPFLVLGPDDNYFYTACVLRWRVVLYRNVLPCHLPRGLFAVNVIGVFLGGVYVIFVSETT